MSPIILQVKKIFGDFEHEIAGGGGGGGGWFFF